MKRRDGSSQAPLDLAGVNRELKRIAVLSLPLAVGGGYALGGFGFAAVCAATDAAFLAVVYLIARHNVDPKNRVP
jgi:hypothetical protein